MGTFVHQDNKDATQYVFDIRQSGIGLPDRDFYLEEKFQDILTAYREHIAAMWQLAGWGDEEAATATAARIVELETKIAQASWDKVRNRDPEATYNKLTLSEVDSLAPGLAIREFLAADNVPADIDTINVGQPDYLTAVSGLFTEVELDTWRDYLRWSVLVRSRHC